MLTLSNDWLLTLLCTAVLIINLGFIANAYLKSDITLHIVSLTSHSPCFFFHCSQAWAVRTHTQQERLKYSKHLCHKTPDKHTHTSIKPLWGSIVLGFCHQATEASENSCLQTTRAHTHTHTMHKHIYTRRAHVECFNRIRDKLEKLRSCYWLSCLWCIHVIAHLWSGFKHKAYKITERYSLFVNKIKSTIHHV